MNFSPMTPQVVGKGGLVGGPVGAGVTVGAVAAAAGALSAKAWSENSESAHTLRLAEVRSHARLVSASGRDNSSLKYALSRILPSLA